MFNRGSGAAISALHYQQKRIMKVYKKPITEVSTTTYGNNLLEEGDSNWEVIWEANRTEGDFEEFEEEPKSHSLWDD